MPDGAMIEVEHLTKVYRNYTRREGLGGAVLDLFKRRHRMIRAVDDVSFSIARGEIVGYIGANGAGKSTTIKMLTGILTPTGGTMTVNGLTPQKDRYAHARQIGVVFGQRTQLWWDLAVIEAFHLLRRIYEIPEARYRQRLEHFIEVLDIRDQLHQPVRKLSLGQRMKCDLCASLLHSPPLLFLDEPTIGLDVAVKERIRRFIKYINREEQSTIILTTHDLTDIEELCPRIIIIDNGKILYDGSQAEIKDRFGRMRRVILQFKQDYLPQFTGLPLPPPELPIGFAGLDPLKLERRDAAAEAAEFAPAGREGQDSAAGPRNGNGGNGARDEAQQAAAEQALPGPRVEPDGQPPEAGGEERASEGVNTLDEPGARQFMAQLCAVMDDGSLLRVRRLSLEQYQVSFDRTKHTAGEVIGRLLERYSVEDLELREPELGDIVRAIYEGKHTL